MRGCSQAGEREVNVVRRLAVESLVRAVLLVPVDDESHFVLEIRLVLGYRDQTQNLLERSMETLHDGDAAVPPDRSESGQDVHGLAPDVLEVLAFELRALVN